MKENKNNTPFKAEDVNWEELAAIGILKDELEMAGELDTLLRGERTNVIALSLVLLGVDVVMDATLQLVRKNDTPLLEINGIRPIGQWYSTCRFPELKRFGERLNLFHL